MAKSNYFENALLKLIFNAITIDGLAQDQVIAPLTHVVVALHTADPGEAGTQATNEIAYTGYLRVPVPRTTAGWTVTNNSVSPAAPISFAEMTDGVGGPITHISVGDGISDRIIYRGALTPNINVSLGAVPRLDTTSVITEE